MNRLVCITLLMCASIPRSCLAMEIEATQPKITITAQTITELKPTFERFIKELELEKYPMLQKLPEPDSLINRVILKAVEWGTSWTRHGRIKPQETKIFLARVFAKDTDERDSTPYTMPPLLQKGIQDLKGKDANDYIQYLNNILNGMEERDLRDKNLGRLAELMAQEKVYYPDMPKSANMGNKELVSDEEFGRFAATQLLATCYVEEKIFFKGQPKKNKHPHSGSKKEPRT